MAPLGTTSRISVGGFPAKSLVEVPQDTEIQPFASWPDFLIHAQNGTLPGEAEGREYLSWEQWPGNVYAASTYGIGNDNPMDSYSLTAQQSRRTLMVRRHASRSAAWPASPVASPRSQPLASCAPLR